MYFCISICLYTMYLHMYLDIHAFISSRIHVFKYFEIICLYIYIIHIHICTYMYTHIHIYIHMCTCICMCNHHLITYLTRGGGAGPPPPHIRDTHWVTHPGGGYIREESVLTKFYGILLTQSYLHTPLYLNLYRGSWQYFLTTFSLMISKSCCKVNLSTTRIPPVALVPWNTGTRQDDGW